MSFHKNTLVTGITAVLLILASVLLYFVFYADLKSSTIQDIEKQQKQVTNIAVGQIEHQLYDLQKRMETIALNPAVRDAQRGESCNQYLQKLVEVNSQEINNLGRVSKDGTFVCAVNRTIIGEPVAKYGDYFEKIKNDPKHTPALSRLISPTGSASRVMALHVPVFDANDQFSGTIGGAIYFDELQKGLLAGTKITQNSVIALYDDNLDVLYNPDPLIIGKKLNAPEVKRLYSPQGALEQLSQKIQQGPKEGTIEYSFRDQPRRATYKSLQIMGRYWTVMVIVPFTDIENAIGRSTAQNLYILLGSLFIITASVATYYALQAKNSKSLQKK